MSFLCGGLFTFLPDASFSWTICGVGDNDAVGINFYSVQSLIVPRFHSHHRHLSLSYQHYSLTPIVILWC